jgi:thiamine biosynthesis protein ThiI
VSLPPDETARCAPPELVLVRYGELSLKGGNRRQFETALMRNIRAAVRHVSPVDVQREHGRIRVVPERRVEEVAHRLQDVFGIKSVSPAWRCEPTPEAIVALARPIVEQAFADVPAGAKRTFRVRSKRGEKRFPLSSMELDRHVADRVLQGLRERVRIRLDDPEVVLGIDVRLSGAYVYLDRHQGPGGLPVGTLGRALCLLSGGIDSPVAAWMAMKRGCLVQYVSFHSYPFIGDSARRKIVELVRALARWQPQSRLWFVPFSEIQLAIRDRCPEAYRTLLYRRAMQRIAGRIARESRCLALITGESLGQVASQTLENIACIAAADPLQVLRPLIAFDKEETIALARRIGSFDISSRAEPDCCTLFMPDRPVIRGERAVCEEAEAGIELDALVERAVAGVERLEVEAE